MPGANYMGGKRNAMKARAKDTIGRQEKGHFGRQRLNPLSQGINWSKPSEKGQQLDLSSSNKVLHKIDLAHARRKDQDGEETTTTTKWFIPSPIHIAPCTPRSRRKIKYNNAHTSSSGGRSKVLEMLNTTEPSFLRAMKEKILAMPDLACLTKVEKPGPIQNKTNIWQPKAYAESLPVTPKRVVNHFKSLNTKSIQLTPGEGSDDSDIGIDFKKKHTTLDKRKTLDIFVSQPSSPNEAARNQYTSTSSLEASSAKRIENHTRYSNDYLSAEKNDEDESFSSPRSTYQHYSTSPTSEEINQVFSDWGQTPPMVYSPVLTGELPTSEDSHGYQRFPALIRLKPLKTWSRSMKDQGSVYGSLFEQDDPWRAIGLILGLPEYQVEQNLDPMMVESYQLHEVENPSNEDISDEDFPILDEGKMPGEEEQEDISDEEPIIEDIWKKISPTSKKMSNRAGSTNLSSSSLAFEENEKELEDNLAPEDFPKPGVREQFTGHEQKTWSDTIFVDTERSPYRADNCEADSIKKDSIIDQMTRDMNEDYYSEAAIGEDMKVDAEDTAVDIFAVPALKEVDGRFIGPSLFDHFEESD